MDFRRFQDGERKQPDYVVVFKTEDEKAYEEALAKSKEASKDFGELPIVVVDVNKCLESEQKKVEELTDEYNKTKQKDLLRQIYQKVRNNRVTTSMWNIKTFCANINLKALKSQIDLDQEESTPKIEDKDKDDTIPPHTVEKEVKLEDLEANYRKTTPQERNEGVKDIKIILERIRQSKAPVKQQEER